MHINEDLSITMCKMQHIHSLTHTHTHIRTHTHTHTHTYTDTYTHTHTHTHTAQTDRGEGQCCLTEIFRQEFTFEERESSRVPDVLGKIVPDVGTEGPKCDNV